MGTKGQGTPSPRVHRPVIGTPRHGVPLVPGGRLEPTETWGTSHPTEADWAWPTAPNWGAATYVTELIYYGFYDLLCPCVEDPETGPFPFWEDLEGSFAKQENVNRREGLNNTQAEKCA